MSSDGNALLSSRQPQSAHKHALLETYGISFVMKLGRGSKAVSLVDGYAGQGRFDDGKAASAELLLIEALKSKGMGIATKVTVVEKDRSRFNLLKSVVDGYRNHAVDAVALHGTCAEHLQTIEDRSKGVPLLLFLDPCGATLPWDDLTTFLLRRGSTPRTELLMNFSAGLTRRASGVLYKSRNTDNSAVDKDALKDGKAAIERMNLVCGGDWWGDVAIAEHVRSGEQHWESAAHAVAEEYLKRLGRATNMDYMSIPVYKQKGQQPIYHLMFLTHDSRGIWVFADSAAKAREVWLGVELEKRDAKDENRGEPLFDYVDEEAKFTIESSVAHIKTNLMDLLELKQSIRVGDYPFEVFGDYLGVARETSVTRAIKQLEKEGKIVREHKDTPPGGGKPKYRKIYDNQLTLIN